ncbi:MAG: hypothetical protein MI924_28565 [Chloroflexales bacterium]|nr:hypothetical protein [Chloroflexales bacterium]
MKAPRTAIFQAQGLPSAYAVVYTVEMDQEPIETAPSLACMHAVMHGYKNLAVSANKMARFMQKHGCAAYPGTALGGVADYLHLAELAGLGVIGYHGLLSSPDGGARLPINVIYANITNLPTLAAPVKENTHLWVRDCCAMCKRCVRQCPVSAIYAPPPHRGAGGMQTSEHASCRDYFTANYGCGVWLAVCPFSHVGYEKVQVRFTGNPAAPQLGIIPLEQHSSSAAEATGLAPSDGAMSLPAGVGRHRRQTIPPGAVLQPASHIARSPWPIDDG